MALKVVTLAALLAVANAGYLGAPAAVGYAAPAVHAVGYAAHVPAAVTTGHANILRSHGNLGQVSTYSNTVDTAHSSSSNSDVRVSNDAVAVAAAPAVHAAVGYAAPAVHAAVGYAAPAVHAVPAIPAAVTTGHANILRSHGNLGQVSTYSNTVDTAHSSSSNSDVRVSNDAIAYAAPAVHAYAAPAVHAYAAPAVHAYAAPAVHAYAAPAVHAYAAPAVHAVHGYAAPAAVHAASHVTFAGIGAKYAW